MAKRFEFDISINCTLDIEQIWPDGDAPINPTVADVRKVFIESGHSRYARGSAIIRAAQEWDLDQDADLFITELE